MNDKSNFFPPCTKIHKRDTYENLKLYDSIIISADTVNHLGF